MLCLKAAEANQPKLQGPVFSAIPNKNERGTGEDGEGKCSAWNVLLSFPWAVNSFLSTSGQPGKKKKKKREKKKKKEKGN